MHRLLALVALVSAPALATGEHVTISARHPLHDTLCVSMTCVASGGDVSVSARDVKGGVEVTVTAGAVKRLTHVIPADDGMIGSTDLVKATALVVSAIERPASSGPAREAPAKKVAARKGSKGRVLARR